MGVRTPLPTTGLRNPILCMYILLNGHGKLFGVYSCILFLNSSEDSVFLISGGKTAHIFGPRKYIVSVSDL